MQISYAHFRPFLAKFAFKLDHNHSNPYPNIDTSNLHNFQRISTSKILTRNRSLDKQFKFDEKIVAIRLVLSISPWKLWRSPLNFNNHVNSFKIVAIQLILSISHWNCGDLIDLINFTLKLCRFGWSYKFYIITSII